MDLFKLVAKLGLDTQEYEKGIEKAKESNKDLGSNTESATEKIQSVWSKMFSAVESDGKSKLESLSAWTLAKARLIVDGIKGIFSKVSDIFKKAISASAENAALDSLASQTFGELEVAANGVFQSIGKDTNILAGRLKSVGTSAFMQFKGAGVDAVNALSMMDKYTRIAADAAAAYNISIEDADTRLRSFIRGNTEAGDMIGLFTSESQRNAKAVELYGTKWTNLTEAQKQMLMLNVTEEIYKQADVLGQAGREGHEWENVIGNLNAALYGDGDGLIPKLVDGFRENLIPVIEKFTDFLTDTTIQGRLLILSKRLGKIAGYVFDGVIDFIDKILAWSNGDAELSPIAESLGKIAEAFEKIGSAVLDDAKKVLEFLFNGMDEEAASNVEEFVKDVADFLNDPAFQTCATVILEIALAWLLLNAPLVLVGAAVGVIATHWKDIKEWAGKALEAVKTFFKEKIVDNVSSFVSGVAEKFNSIKSWATDAAENVKAFFETQIVDNVKEFVSGVAEKFDDIKQWASDSKTNLENFINTHIPEGFLSDVQSALETVSGLVDGIKGAWDAFVDSLNTTNVQKRTQSIQEGWESGGVGGAASAAWDSAWFNPANWGKKKDNSASPSKATGLDYVPYDNFSANLHAGEAVLNRADATAYREGRTGTGVDYAMLGQAVGAAVREALNGIGVNMDGQRVGKITAPIVSREIAREAHARRYVTV